MAQPECGFSLRQDAVISIQPPTTGTVAVGDEPVLSLYNALTVTSSDAEYYNLNFKVLYVNALYRQASFYIELFTKNPDGTYKQQTQDAEPTVIDHSTTWGASFTLPKITSDADGTQQVYLMARCVAANGTPYDGRWRLLTGPQVYVERTVKGGEVKLAVKPAIDFDATSCVISRGTGQAEQSSDLTVTFRNNADEYQGQINMRAYFIGNDAPEAAFQGLLAGTVEYDYWTKDFYTGAYLRAGQSTDVIFPFRPWCDGTFLLLFFDSNSTKNVIAHTSITIPATPTAISSIGGSTPATTDAYYDLQGRRIAQPQHRGLYIVGGKKVVIGGLK